MEEELVEIYISEDGAFVLLLGTLEVQEISDEIGWSEYEFTPYCG